MSLPHILLVGAVDFLGVSLMGYGFFIQHDPEPPPLQGELPHLTDILTPWSASRIQWSTRTYLAHYDPWRRQISLSRHWQTHWDLLAAHVVAHERSHADQRRLWTISGGLTWIEAIFWGIIAGLASYLIPGSDVWGMMAQWLSDGLLRRRVERDADQQAVQRLVRSLDDPVDKNAVKTWGEALARRHHHALMLESVGRSGLTLMVTVSVQWIALRYR